MQWYSAGGWTREPIDRPPEDVLGALRSADGPVTAPEGRTDEYSEDTGT